MNESEVIELVIKEQNCHGIHIECSDPVSDQIMALMTQQFTSFGVVYREDMLYERLKVGQYLEFFCGIHDNSERIHRAVSQMQLEHCLTAKIKNLTYGEKRRVSIAREIIHGPEYLFIQEPLLNLDESSRQCILKWMEDGTGRKTQLFTSSVSLKLLYLMEGIYFYVDEKAVTLLNHVAAEEKSGTSSDEVDVIARTTGQEAEPVRKIPVIEKISARVEDKVLLFNPGDIDYFEAVNGKVYLYVRRESFPTTFTLDELEVQLHKYGFFRCHRSCLVNMQKVTQVIRWTRNSYSLKIDGDPDADLPLSKGRIEELKAIYRF